MHSIITLKKRLQFQFNWTMGHLTESDIPAPEGYILHRRTEEIRSFHKHKLGLIQLEHQNTIQSPSN
jgi:hypothetical protein